MMSMHRSTWFHTGIYLIDAQDEQERLSKRNLYAGHCAMFNALCSHLERSYVHLLDKPSQLKTVNISKSNQLHLRSWKTTDDAAAAAVTACIAATAV